VCLPFAPSLATEVARAHAGVLLWAVYLGLVPTAIGFSTWAYALARIDAGRPGSMTYLVPPISVTLGWLALGGTPPLLALPGRLLCIAGVVVTRLAPAGPRRPQLAHHDLHQGDRTQLARAVVQTTPTGTAARPERASPRPRHIR
jgi:drug/metabolite transporter (DMT)-like permease